MTAASSNLRNLPYRTPLAYPGRTDPRPGRRRSGRSIFQYQSGPMRVPFSVASALERISSSPLSPFDSAWSLSEHWGAAARGAPGCGGTLQRPILWRLVGH